MEVEDLNESEDLEDCEWVSWNDILDDEEKTIEQINRLKSKNKL